MRNKAILYLLLTVLIVLARFNANATHIYGGELLYEALSATEYKVSLTIYGDCSGSAFPYLDSASPVLSVYNAKAIFTTRSLIKEPGSGVEVTPVCPEESGNTACKRVNAPLPGIAKYVYSTVVTIPFPSADWSFVFAGNTAPGSAGRSNSIDNIYIPQTGSLMYLEATLNNISGPNSSPKYTSIPTPFFCVNKAQEYNQGAVDGDNDSLSFSLTPALETTTATVNYVTPYTATAPLAAAPGTFRFNEVNGQMSFTPNLSQVSLVANKVEEYKNGVLVGTSMREMTFIVLSNCGNSAPLGKIDSNVIGGATAPGNTVNVCQGIDYVEFNIDPVDADGDIINISTSGVNFGGTLTLSNNNTKNPHINFVWKPDTAQALGAYTFFITYKDNGCPLSSNQTVAYTVKVVNPFDVSYSVLAPTQCVHSAYVQIKVAEGVSPKVLHILRNDVIIATYVDSNLKDGDPLVVRDSFLKGNYTLLAYSPYLRCSTFYSMPIVDSGKYPFPPFFKDKHFCLNDPVQPISIKIDTTTYRLNWYDKNNVPLSVSPPTYTTDSVKLFTWRISQTHLVCESDKVDYSVGIHGPPIAQVLNNPGRVCLGDKIYLLAAGGERYRWYPADQVFTDNSTGQVYTKVMTPTTYTVVAFSHYGCMDTSEVTYNDIEQCCTFSYPNAFTPNGDGVNDRFRALLYGNTSEYYLAIFNRWGQEVFHTNDPNTAWDGKFKDALCDVGVYYYRVKAKCLTGHEEQTGGEFTLIR